MKQRLIIFGFTVTCLIVLFGLLPTPIAKLQTQPLPTPTFEPPVETWQYQDYAVGIHAGNEDDKASILMANVIRLDNGTYRMFYNKSMPDANQIKYAESPEGITWTVKGMVLQGSSNPDDRNYVLGGPSVVKLPNGQYRMYYRTAPKHATGSPPKYHIRSAISTNGITFTEEAGIRVDIYPNDPTSPLGLAGHGTFFIATNGTYVGIFSGNRITETTQPSGLFMTTSSDGLTWGNYRLLYPGFHDPTVVKKDGKYYMYAMYLHYYNARAISEDGLTWPTQANRIATVSLQGETITGVGDVGAVLDPLGQIRLYSNWNDPATEIIYLKQITNKSMVYLPLITR